MLPAEDVAVPMAPLPSLVMRTVPPAIVPFTVDVAVPEAVALGAFWVTDVPEMLMEGAPPTTVIFPDALDGLVAASPPYDMVQL